jgi:opacity protein-like surface antigen
MFKKVGLMLMILLVAVPLLATEGEKQAYGMFGITYNPDLESHMGFGGGVFFGIGERFGAQVEFSYSPDVTPDWIQPVIDEAEAYGLEVRLSSRMIIFNGDFVYQFADLEEGVAPYVAGGAGLLWMSASATVSYEDYSLSVSDSDSSFVVDFGGGVKVAAGENLFIRADYRLFIIAEGEGDFSDRLVHRITGAVGYRF